MTSKDRELIEAAVKMESLLFGVDVATLDDDNVSTLVWLNAWLGPHWILIPGALLNPVAGGVGIQRKGKLVYRGTLSTLAGSQLFREHAIARKEWHPDFLEDILDLASGLVNLLSRSAGLLSPAELSSEVTRYFDEALVG